MIEFLDRPVRWLAKLSALLGGLVLLAVMVMTVVSVAGNALSKLGFYLKNALDMPLSPLLALAPIPGETEMVEIALPFIIVAFLPIVTLNKGHASVEIITNFFGGRVNRLIDLLVDLSLLGALVFLGYRHYLGLTSKMKYNEVTQILGMPLWWGYMAMTLIGVIFLIAAVFCVLRSAGDLVNGHTRKTSGAVH